MAKVQNDEASRLSRRHFRFGWWSLFVFVGLGLILETLHAFKVRGYLDVSSETRRLMWTLAHAHGTLLALIHFVFAIGVGTVPQFAGRHRRRISGLLIGASLMIPTGFFLGGVDFYAGDPGIGAALLVPVGGALLLTAAFLGARGADSSDHGDGA